MLNLVLHRQLPPSPGHDVVSQCIEVIQKIVDPGIKKECPDYLMSFSKIWRIATNRKGMFFFFEAEREDEATNNDCESATVKTFVLYFNTFKL